MHGLLSPSILQIFICLPWRVALLFILFMQVEVILVLVETLFLLGAVALWLLYKSAPFRTLYHVRNHCFPSRSQIQAGPTSRFQ